MRRKGRIGYERDEVDGGVGERRGNIYIKKDINMGRLYNYYHRNDITNLTSYDRHGSDLILSPQCNS